MEFAILSALIGLALFMAGQWWGQRQTKQRAQMMCHVMDKAFNAYRSNMEAVLKEKGLDPKALEAIALQRHVDSVMKDIGDHISKMVKENPSTTVVIGNTPNDKDKEQGKSGD